MATGCVRVRDFSAANRFSRGVKFQEKGISELKYLSENRSIRRFPANMFLCQYHLIISTYVGNIKADPEFCKTILDESLEIYPDSCIFMILNARYYLVMVRKDRKLTCAISVVNYVFTAVGRH